MVIYGRTYRELKLHICPKSVQIKKSPRSREDSSGAVGLALWAKVTGRIYANVLTFRFLASILIFHSQRLHCRRYIFYLVV